MQPNGLNNRVLKTLSQSAPKAAVDLLGMREFLHLLMINLLKL